MGRRFLLAGEVGLSAHLAESWLFARSAEHLVQEEEALLPASGESARLPERWAQLSLQARSEEG